MLGPASRDGFHTVTPYLMVADPDGLVTFLGSAFEATVTYRTKGGGGGDHIEVQIGDSRIMVGGPVEASQPSALFLYVDDVDGLHDRAVQSGASSMMPPTDGEFEEERGAAVVDPAGNQWFLGRHGPGSASPD